MNVGFQCGARSLHRPAFYDAITGPTESIKEGKSLGILLYIIYYIVNLRRISLMCINVSEIVLQVDFQSKPYDYRMVY